MIEIFNWLQAHGKEVLTVLTGIVTAASTIAALTPTPADDTFVGKVYKVIDFLALNVLKAKDTGSTETK